MLKVDILKLVLSQLVPRRAPGNTTLAPLHVDVTTHLSRRT